MESKFYTVLFLALFSIILKVLFWQICASCAYFLLATYLIVYSYSYSYVHVRYEMFS